MGTIGIKKERKVQAIALLLSYSGLAHLLGEKEQVIALFQV